MQKYILLILIITFIPTHTMKTPLPYIVYDINIDTVQPNSFANKLLSKEFPCIGYDETDQLSHTHTLVTQVHSPQYLTNIDQHPSIMRSAINNNIFLSLLPNRWNKPYFTSLLKDSAITIVATKYLINKNNNKHNYTISINEGNSFAGHAEGNQGHAYATIAIAAAYALNTKTIKSILVIDENITPETSNDYYNHGNGTIFYPKNNPKLKDLFGNKIITQDKLPTNVWDFINDSDKQTDLVFYNMNIENNHTEQRKTNILALLKKLIPTVFILSGDKDTHQDKTCEMINDIVKINESAKKLRNIDTHIQFLSSQTSSNRSSSHDDDYSSYDTQDNSNEEDSDDNNILVFKVTTKPENTWEYDGANFIYLANKIDINDGVMEIELHDKYAAYGGYRYHSPTSSSDSDDS